MSDKPWVKSYGDIPVKINAKILRRELRGVA